MTEAGITALYIWDCKMYTFNVQLSEAEAWAFEWNAPGLSTLQDGSAMTPEGLIPEQGYGINCRSRHDEEAGSTRQLLRDH